MTRELSERQALLRDARELLAWEAELGGGFVPQAELSPLAAAEALHRTPPAPAEASAPRGPAAAAALHAPAAAAALLAPAAALVAPAAAADSMPPALVSPVHGKARLEVLAQLEHEVRACTRCELARSRTHTVFARGNPEARLVFVGEGPGQEEDLSGQPFVGAAGKLLDKMVEAMGFARDDVYICNVVKCRPPGNRTPLPAEALACAPYLHGQIDAVAPKVLVALGRCAAESMGLVAGGGWRGRWGSFRGIAAMATYHPAYLLRSPEQKRPVWEDLQQVMTRLKAP